jgi:hypothetical protein
MHTLSLFSYNPLFDDLFSSAPIGPAAWGAYWRLA